VARRADTSGRIDEKSITRLPLRALAYTPSGAVSTCSTSGESGTMVAMTSASATASAIDPCTATPSTVFGLRLYPTTSKPALARLLAIGLPMMPSPMKATVVISHPSVRAAASRGS
jgi:hypothetical protein